MAFTQKMKLVGRGTIPTLIEMAQIGCIPKAIQEEAVTMLQDHQFWDSIQRILEGNEWEYDLMAQYYFGIELSWSGSIQKPDQYKIELVEYKLTGSVTSH